MGTKKLGNSPKMLMFQLLYIEEPNLNYDKILKELHKVYPSAEYAPEAKVFVFPEIELEFEETKAPVQCVVMEGEKNKRAPLEDSFFKQNWHWAEATEVEQKCMYAVAVSDFMSRGLEPRIRVVLMQQILLALIKVSKPAVLVSIQGEKLINPIDFEQDCQDPNYVALDLCVNVRLFNIENPELQPLLMDTLGLHSLGLSDFQLFFTDEQRINEVASRLWDYAYYVMHMGDVIEDGHTIEGLEQGSKWWCHRKWSVSNPKRTVLDVEIM